MTSILGNAHEEIRKGFLEEVAFKMILGRAKKFDKQKFRA